VVQLQNDVVMKNHIRFVINHCQNKINLKNESGEKLNIMRTQLQNRHNTKTCSLTNEIVSAIWSKVGSHYLCTAVKQSLSEMPWSNKWNCFMSINLFQPGLRVCSKCAPIL